MRLLKIICVLILLPVSLFTAVAEQQNPIMMQWGIPDEAAEYFPALPREVKGDKVHIDGPLLSLTVKQGSACIIPIYAVSDEELTGVRYRGSGIPRDMEIHWLDPFSGRWIALEEIPEEEVLVHIIDRGDTYDIDLGPPGEGAVFSDRIPRFIWFALTPRKAGTSTITLFGYLASPENRVTTRLECRITAAARD